MQSSTKENQMSNSTVPDNNVQATDLVDSNTDTTALYSKIEGRPGMCWGKFQLNPANFSKIEGQLRSVSDFLK